MTEKTAARALVVGEALVDVVLRPGADPAEHPGGSPANVAIGLGRLGRRVDLLPWLGPDADGAATYEFDLAWDLPGRWDEDEDAPAVVHTGSIATVIAPGGEAVARLLADRRDGSTITYDPNL